MPPRAGIEGRSVTTSRVPEWARSPRFRDEAVPVMVALTALGLCLEQLLIPPVVALANNGDFVRLLAMVGLHSTGPGYSVQYAWLHFALGGTPAPGGTYLTSYLGVAGLMSAVAHLSGGFDTRILAVFLTVLLAAVLYLLVRSIPGQGARLATGAVLIIGLCDSRLVAYLDTWYDEPWSLLLLLALTTWFLRNQGARTISRRALTWFVAIAALLMTSKVQNVALIVPIVATVFVMTRKRLRQSAIPSVLLAAIALTFVVAQSGVYAGENHYDLIFDDLLLRVHDPVSTLKSLGLSPTMKSYIGTNAYETAAFGRPSGIDTSDFKHFESNDPTAHLAVFYATHPAVAAEEIARGLREGWKSNLPYLGYRTASSGARPFAGACEPCVYSTATAGLSPAGIPVTAVLFGGVLLLARVARRRSLAGAADALVCLCAISATSLVAAVFGEGHYEEVKHLYLFYTSNLALLAISIGVGCNLIVGRRASEQGPSEPAPT